MYKLQSRRILLIFDVKNIFLLLCNCHVRTDENFKYWFIVVKNTYIFGVRLLIYYDEHGTIRLSKDKHKNQQIKRSRRPL